MKKNLLSVCVALILFCISNVSVANRPCSALAGNDWSGMLVLKDNNEDSIAFSAKLRILNSYPVYFTEDGEPASPGQYQLVGMLWLKRAGSDDTTFLRLTVTPGLISNCIQTNEAYPNATITGITLGLAGKQFGSKKTVLTATDPNRHPTFPETIFIDAGDFSGKLTLDGKKL